MNENELKGNAKAAKGKTKEVTGKVTGDKSTEYKGKVEKHQGKAGAVLGDINGEAKKTNK